MESPKNCYQESRNIGMVVQAQKTTESTHHLSLQNKRKSPKNIMLGSLEVGLKRQNPLHGMQSKVLLIPIEIRFITVLR